ncbi:hypothetical protein EJ02DRAFT_514946 [Clathrospora elynae]|uniref:Zn(2)-C6 fungal-type domain-containing protein n=1 Tax=Clathrospora elynae TaxID=706981 RepID=A0A6A5SKD0_9PLEO|nr:hypothetical protein EJ02DRAFT_514946 [Clathrospora elynae]
MVYRGRPSAACFACRARRIKCDQIKLGCTQCRRMRMQCPGYHNPLDQLFRDESANVAQRAQKSYRNAKYCAVGSRRDASTQRHEDLSSEANSSPMQPTTSCHQSDIASPSVLPGLSQPIEAVALAHFMSSYVPRSHFDYLPGIFAQPFTGLALSATVHAVSVASLAREVGHPNLENLARRLYAKALSETNAALAVSQTATSDATLISVLLLSLFEAIVWASPGIPANWNTHTRGALALVKLRGSRQFDSPIGARLFAQVANIICIDTVQQKRRLPSDLVDILKVAEHHHSGHSRFKFASLTGEVADLRADIDAGGMTTDEVLDAAQSLDGKYVEFASFLRTLMDFQEFVLKEPRSGVYGNKVHYYPSHRAAQFWNSYRMTRIVLNETIHDHAFGLPCSSRVGIQEYAIANIQQMAEDICASIPQYTITSGFSDIFDVCCSFPKSSSADTQLTFSSRKASTMSLLWPLSTVRGIHLASEDVKAYAVERLQALGSEFRVPQTYNLVAGCSEADALEDDGLHMFYVS